MMTESLTELLVISHPYIVPNPSALAPPTCAIIMKYLQRCQVNRILLRNKIFAHHANICYIQLSLIIMILNY